MRDDPTFDPKSSDLWRIIFSVGLSGAVGAGVAVKALATTLPDDITKAHHTTDCPLKGQPPREAR
jgi:hypothetical protein